MPLLCRRTAKDLIRLRGCILYINSLRGHDNLGRVSVTFHKGDNFCEFLFASLQIESLLEKGFTLKGKNMLSMGANSLSLA